jgi:hypothetical protein
MSVLTKKWVKTLPMAEMLGKSPTALCRLAKKDLAEDSGYLKKGFHYNQLGEGKNSPFYWHVERTMEVFENWGAPVQEVQK